MSSNRYKCVACKIVISEDLLDDGKCPECKSGINLEKMCPNDHVDCGHDIVEGLAYCPICGEGMCPKCGSHDIEQLSRITGYIQAVSGYNAGKAQELKDRHRYMVT